MVYVTGKTVGRDIRLFFGKKSLEKETSMEQKTGACPDFFVLITIMSRLFLIIIYVLIMME